MSLFPSRRALLPNTATERQAMDILHILRSAPDTTTEKMMSDLSRDRQVNVIKLYTDDPDWAGVVDTIFAHNRVVCW